MILPMAVALGAAMMMLTAGYLMGVRQALGARERLRAENAALVEEAARLRERSAQRRGEDDNLRAAIRHVLTPLVQREQLSVELSHLESGVGPRRDLNAFLDQLVAKANFFGALLTDDQGWPVASSSGLLEPDRLCATASLLRLLADRIQRDGGTAPLSMTIHDAANVTTLTRLFSAGGQNLSLTAISAGRLLAPSALDPALAKLSVMLLNREAGATASA
ncbi:MAG TPA: hypothetical protein VMU33_01740 [Burkholderiaceae bacterium]|nr:hypothetical protein [Burkholderiaceae bacterium]